MRETAQDRVHFIIDAKKEKKGGGDFLFKVGDYPLRRGQQPEPYCLACVKEHDVSLRQYLAFSEFMKACGDIVCSQWLCIRFNDTQKEPSPCSTHVAAVPHHVLECSDKTLGR